ncbi:MAG: putative Ntn-hydrolase superfamily protein, partial [Planctomycetota bacterium]
MPSLRAVLTFLVGLLLFAAPASATWSIVIVNLVTGEVAVGIATCLTGFDLRPNTVVIVPGHGAAAAQSFVGPLSLRQLIRDGFLTGESAAQIMANLAAADTSHQMRQYGIVSLTGGEATFTGTGAGAWAGGVTGQVGDFRYAIQGNVLTGQPVIAAAEQAVLTTPGGLPDKLMAAMEAARSMGGDGRCSCSSGNPTGCGSPPASFTKSSHIALMIVSRPSDVDAPCTGSLGCGAGDYWLDLNVANQPAGALDPVLQLQTMFNTWKANQVGRPDHYESVVSLSGTTIRANGVDTVTATVELRDEQGTPLGNALPLTVGLAPNSTVSNITFSPAVAEPNGTYTFTMQGDLDAGVAVLDIAATDAFGRVGIWPRPMVTVLDLFGVCGTGAIPDGQGGALPALKVNGSFGDDRVVEVGYGQPFTLTLDPPVGVPGTSPVGMFALWINNGQPLPGSVLPLGPTGGSMCFTPSLLSPGAPNVLLADSFGLGGLIAAAPAPWSLTVPGLPLVLDVSLQGV